MPITIFSNISAVRAQEQLRKSTQLLNRNFERLSSGLRINRASDDAAGLAVSESLRSDTRLANTAVRNINDGISLVSVAENALSQINTILTRMAELATQVANGTLTNEQKSPLFAEYVTLGSEINRIVQTSKFNDIVILSTTQKIAIQAGIASNEDNQIILNDVQIDTDNLGLRLDNIGYMTTETVSDAIDTIGTLQLYNAKRLEFALNNAMSMRENFATAASQIRDVDVAEEAADLVKNQILQQAGQAILAQANIQPQFALSLLPPVLDNS